MYALQQSLSKNSVLEIAKKLFVLYVRIPNLSQDRYTMYNCVKDVYYLCVLGSMAFDKLHRVCKH